MNVPAFRKSIQIDAVPREGIVIGHEAGHLILEGAMDQAILTLIDGERSCDEIADALADRFPYQHTYYALNWMERQGIIYDRSALDDGALPLAWHYLAADLGRTCEALSHNKVRLRATAQLDESLTPDGLAAYGLESDESASFQVVFATDYLDDELAAINRAALESRHSWMLVKPVGTLALIGPIFRPGVSACWECLAYRLRDAREVERYSRSHEAARFASPAPFTAAAAAVQSIASLHAAMWLTAGESPLLEGKIVSLDLKTLVTCLHVVTKRPACPVCGRPTPAAKERPRLDNRERQLSVDTGHRSHSPEATYARFQHHVSPVCGIVSQIAPVSEASNEIVKLFAAKHNFPLSRDSLFFLGNSMQTTSCGKGMTDAQARTGALCEALERYCGTCKGDEVTIKASFRELGEQAIHPNACMLYSSRQYQERSKWQALGSIFNLVPEPFPEDEAIDWTPLWSFGLQSFRYLPTAYLYYGHPSKLKEAYCWADSNGNAAGNSLEEAAVQGFLELVERDAVAVWWYNRLQLPAVDLRSFENDYVQKCIQFYALQGRELWVLDLTSDIGIPVFAALSRRSGTQNEEIIFGFGAHFDADVALIRSIVEMNQFLPVVSGPIGADGQRVFSYHDNNAIHWWRTETVAQQPNLLPHPAAAPRQRRDYSPASSGDQLVDLMTCVNRARLLGMDTLLLDQTREEVGLSVAKVIVPGMRHFWARYAPGRLYEVPVRLGRLPRPLSEDELNPIPMFV